MKVLGEVELQLLTVKHFQKMAPLTQTLDPVDPKGITYLLYLTIVQSLKVLEAVVLEFILSGIHFQSVGRLTLTP